MFEPPTFWGGVSQNKNLPTILGEVLSAKNIVVFDYSTDNKKGSVLTALLKLFRGPCARTATNNLLGTKDTGAIRFSLPGKKVLNGSQIASDADFRVFRLSIPVVLDVRNKSPISALIGFESLASCKLSEENESTIGRIIGGESFLEGVVSFFKRPPLFFESTPLQASNYSEGESDRRSNKQTHDGKILTSILFAFGFSLFCFIGLKFVRKILDSDGHFFLRFSGVLAALVCAALCFVYGLLNLLAYSS